MRLGKRTLAGAAAGALALGVLTIATAPAASAGKSIKPKAAITNTVTAVRAGTVGTIPFARLTFAKSSAKPTTLQLVTSPSGATIFLNNTAGNTPASSDDSATLTAADSTLTAVGTVSGDDSTYGIAVTTAGSYTARLGNGTDTATFSFTTAGAPASMTLTPATTEVLVGGTATLTVTLKDSAGNTTQPAIGDSVALSTSGDDTLTPTSYTAATLYQGTSTLTVLTDTAGSQTITATPQGTLPSGGVAAATATVTAAGTVSSSAIINATVTSPSNAINDPATGNSVARTSQVPANTTSVTVRIDDTTANAAGTKVRLGFNITNSAVIDAGATINGSLVTSADDTKFVDVTTGSDKSATTTLTLGGSAVSTGTSIIMKQFKVDNTVVSGFTSLTITELNPQVYASGITISPDDSVVAKLAASTPVAVTVEDSFGTPQSGWTIRAYRGATAVTLLSSGTTNASGEASVAVTSASTAVNGTVEQYSFTATPPVGTAVTVNNALQITYTTDGSITLLTVTATAGTSPTSSASTLTTGARILVPNTGVLAGAFAASTSTFTISTGVDDTTNITANYAKYVPTTSPLSAVTVTTPEGVFVTDDTTKATWSNGVRSKLVSSGTSVYIYGTKAGIHTVTFASGGKSVDVKVKIGNTAAMAYNIALTPAKQTVGSGAITTATLKVTDVFGNPVQTSEGTGEVEITASGEVLLAGYDTEKEFVTDASGEATVTVIAGASAGAGLLTAAPAAGDAATAWQTGYTKPTGAPAPVTSATAEVTVGASPVTKSITIMGSRTTVGGKPGIMIDGITVGIEDGKTVIPYVRFPGGEYTKGSARPVITDDAFEWTRKTGKKSYVYFTNDDGAVKSNSVIIAAN